MGKKVIGAVLVVVGIVMMGSDGGKLIQIGGQMLAMAGLSMMITPNVTQPSNRRNLKYNPRSGVEPRRLIYGNVVTSGPLVYAETLPSADYTFEDQLHRIVVLAGHAIESIDEVWLSDQKTKLDDIDDNFSSFPADNWKIGDKKSLILGVTQWETDAPDSVEAIQIRKAAGSAWALGGTDSESADNKTVSDATATASTRKLNECPYIYVRLRLEEDGWNSIPQIRAVVKGKRILRANEIQSVWVANPTWTGKQVLDFMRAVDANNNLVNSNSEGQPYLRYNNNSANCILDYLLDEKLGLGIPLEEIDLDTFVAAEDTSDEIVYAIPVTENLNTFGTDTDFNDFIVGNTTYNLETETVRNPYVNINIGPQTSYLNGTITITMPNGDVLEDMWTGNRFPNKRGFRYVSGSSGNSNNYSNDSYIDISTGLVVIKTEPGYNSGSSGNVSISYTASNRYDSVRYTCDGVISLDTTPIQIIEEMLTSCVGLMAYSQGKYKLYVGKWETPKNITLTEEDLAGPIQVRTTIPRNERFNAVKGVFADKDSEWELTDFPEVKNESYRLADVGSDDYINSNRTGYLYRDINLPFTTNVDTARRLAKLFLDRARQALSLQLTCKPSALRFSPGENITVSLPTLAGGEPTRADFIPANIQVDTDANGNLTNLNIIDGGLGYLYPPRLDVDLPDATEEAILIPVLNGTSIVDVIIQRKTTANSGYTANQTNVSIDVFYDNNSLTFWTDKIFKVESWSVNTDGLIDLGLKEDTQALYTDSMSEFSYDISPDIDDGTATGRKGMEPRNLRLTTTSKSLEGQFVGGVRATWQPPEDTRNIQYYEIELGTGAKWQKKIQSISTNSANREAILFSPSVTATIDWVWQAAQTVDNPLNISIPGAPANIYRQEPNPGLPPIFVPARLNVSMNNVGAGYKPLSSESRLVYTEITSGGQIALVSLYVNEDGTLSSPRVINITGDFTGSGTASVSLVEKDYSSLVSFTLSESIVDYPDYRTLITRFGPESAYVFDNNNLSSFTGGYSPFTVSGTYILNTSFNDGVAAFDQFTNIGNCLRLSTTATAESVIDTQYVDLYSDSRTFSIESVVVLEDTSQENIWRLTSTSDTLGLGLSINVGTDTLQVTNQLGTIFGVDTSALENSFNLLVDTPYHIVYKERGSSALGEFLAELYVNGTRVASSTDATNNTTANRDKFILGGGSSTIRFGAFNIYKKCLTKSNIELAYSELDNDSFPSLNFADIEAFTITDINQPEFNGYKNQANKAQMTSNTSGTYRLNKINEISSFIPDTDGLPGVNEGTFGAFVYSADKSTWHPIQSVTRTADTVNSPPRAAVNEVTFKSSVAGIFNVGEEVQVFGVYDPNREDNFSGKKIISAVPNSTTIQWLSPTNGKVTQSVEAVLDKDEAYLMLDYPQNFIINKKVPKGTNSTEIFEGVVNTLEHTVRIRSVDKFNRRSDWVTSSIYADADDTIPNPIYFKAYNGNRQITFEFDFNINPNNIDYSSILSDYHTETNLSHIELVVVREGTTRYNALGDDPGGRAGVTRNVINIPINSNAQQILDGKVEYIFTTNQFGTAVNYYAWARLVTKSGQVSKWYTDDDGSTDVNGAHGGLGPLRADASTNTNLVGNDNSDTSTGTISDTSNPGPANPPDDPDNDDPGDPPIYTPYVPNDRPFERPE